MAALILAHLLSAFVAGWIGWQIAKRVPNEQI